MGRDARQAYWMDKIQTVKTTQAYQMHSLVLLEQLGRLSPSLEKGEHNPSISDALPSSPRAARQAFPFPRGGVRQRVYSNTKTRKGIQFGEAYGCGSTRGPQKLLIQNRDQLTYDRWRADEGQKSKRQAGRVMSPEQNRPELPGEVRRSLDLVANGAPVVGEGYGSERQYRRKASAD
ncbi:hypothetical protein U1Q18_015498 [Sarracenia purpurea var. burkii]